MCLLQTFSHISNSLDVVIHRAEFLILMKSGLWTISFMDHVFSVVWYWHILILPPSLEWLFRGLCLLFAAKTHRYDWDVLWARASRCHSDQTHWMFKTHTAQE